MKKTLSLITGWLIALSIYAQYNYFDHYETFDTINKVNKGIKKSDFDYGIFDGNGASWSIDYLFKPISEEELHTLRGIFTKGLSKSQKATHKEIHQEGKDTIEIRSSFSFEIFPTDSFNVMGMKVTGSCQMMADLYVDRMSSGELNGTWIIGIRQEETCFDHVKESSLRMDKTLKAILAESTPKIYEVVYDKRPKDDSFTFAFPNMFGVERTEAIIYEFDRYDAEKFQRLLSTLYDHLDYQERFAFEIQEFRAYTEFALSVMRPNKPGYITWMVYHRGNRLLVLRAEGDEGINVDDNWYDEKTIQSHLSKKSK